RYSTTGGVAVLEAEDEARAEVNEGGGLGWEVSAGADGGCADGDQRPVADLEDAKVDVSRQGVVDTSEDGVIQLADSHGGILRLGTTIAQSSFEIGSEGAGK